MRLTPDFEHTLRKYALGDLDEGLRLELEELLMTDADAFEALGVIEDELIEEYLEETGTAVDRQAFERHFLDSPHGLERLRFARALRTRASRQRAVVRTVARPAWIGLAALLVMSLAGNFLTLTSRMLPASRALTTSGPASPAQRVLPPGPSVATFALAGGLLRAGGSLPHLNVPVDAIVVRLRMDLPANDYALYRATLLDGEGEEVWSASKVRAEEEGGRTGLFLPVASELLPPGDYQVKLSGIASNGEREAVGAYPFRVTRD